ncbi:MULTISPECIES: hypothetical protein [unclassified Psychrobacillus]|uniref:hypothetical protein n=1 Tax=unclassified Psychrobacillus TaxID=2636677 RepID=UPI0012B0F41D|nr:hypothetical protein GI482_18090 [Bacillus sp. N3536]
MQYREDRLPQNAKEGILFLLIISIISVNTIAPIIMGLEREFSKEVYIDTLKIIPIMWVVVVLLVRLVAGPLVGKIMPKFVGQTDGFNARILLNTVLNVTVLSICLSIIGTWIGMGEVTLDPFKNFLHIWPRNFAIAFWIELIVAQPIARFVMKKMHQNKANKVVSA